MRYQPLITRPFKAIHVAYLIAVPLAFGVGEALAGPQAAEDVASTTNLMAVFGGVLGAVGLGFLYWLYRNPGHTGYEDPSKDSRKIDEAAGG